MVVKHMCRMAWSKMLYRWSYFRPFWPTSSGPKRKLLGGHNSVMFILGTRLHSSLLILRSTC